MSDGTRRRRPARPWCVPPAMLRDPADTLEGACILEESPGELGLLLWRTVGDVTLWGMTPHLLRADLFADGTADGRFALLAGTDMPAKVSASVDTLHGMLAMPDRADAEIVALCCLEVAAWARGAGLPHTAIAFAQAGAVAAPEFGEAALCVGAYARAAGQDARAETWLRRTLAVARREGDRNAYACALAELGGMYERRGNTPRAERLYRVAMRSSRRFGARAVRMRAAHGLFRLARQTGDDAAATQFALIALRALQPDAELAAEGLLLDLARFWTDLGEPARARWVLRRLVPALVTMAPAGQLAALALTARAHAERGHVQSGRTAARAAWPLLTDDTLPDDVRYAAAVDLVHAARAVGERPAFDRARRLALRLAPQAEFPAVAERMAKLWPEAAKPAFDRAS